MKPSSNEYVAFLQKYNQNPTDLSLLNDYATYMSKYAEPGSQIRRLGE